MKMRHLPEIDLARIAPLSRDRKRELLRRQKEARAPYSYDPTRTATPDIFNTQYDLLGPVSRTSWDKIEDTLRRESRSPMEFQANRVISDRLYRYSERRRIVSRSENFFPFPIGVGETVKYWFRLSFVEGGELVIPFVDPRKRNSLGPTGRRFAFSMMHESIRAADPDYEGARLLIIHFGTSIVEGRTMNLYTDAGVALYAFEALDQMVRETYEIWREVLEEREEEVRRRGAGSAGPLV